MVEIGSPKARNVTDPSLLKMPFKVEPGSIRGTSPHGVWRPPWHFHATCYSSDLKGDERIL